MSAVLVQYLRVAEPAEARRLAWRVDAAPCPREPDLRRRIEDIQDSGAPAACLAQLRTALARSEHHLSGLPGNLSATLRRVGAEILSQSADLIPIHRQPAAAWEAPESEESPHVRCR